MAQRLLPTETALRKIELSLKLQGKSFNTNFLTCGNCKFCWKNTPAGSSPRWNRIKGAPEEQQPPRPEKLYWYCFRYTGKPYHSFIYFKKIRLNAEGQEIPIQYRWDEKEQKYTTEPRKGERDIAKVETYTTYRRRTRGMKYRVCRRFEACPR